MGAMFFGQYLLSKGVISREALIDAIELQRLNILGDRPCSVGGVLFAQAQLLHLAVQRTALDAQQLGRPVEFPRRPVAGTQAHQGGGEVRVRLSDRLAGHLEGPLGQLDSQQVILQARRVVGG